MKKFITPKDYPHDKCINIRAMIILKKIYGITTGSFNDFYDDTIDTIKRYAIFFETKRNIIRFEYFCEKQRDKVFDMILEDLNKNECYNEEDLISRGYEKFKNRYDR